MNLLDTTESHAANGSVVGCVSYTTVNLPKIREHGQFRKCPTSYPLCITKSMNV